MAQFNLEKDWPIIAAAGAGLVGVYLLTRSAGGLQPVVVGGGTPAGYSEAVQAQASVTQATLQAKTAAFQTLATEFAQTERTRLEAQAATTAVQAQAGVQQQGQTLSFLTAALPFLFSWETTARGFRRREFSRQRMLTAYGRR